MSLLKFAAVVGLVGTIVCAEAHAQDQRHHAAEFAVNFRVGNAVLDLGYMGTGVAFSALADTIRRVGLSRIDTVEVISYSSPEGPSRYNLDLSKRRAAAVNKYLSNQFDHSFSAKLHLRPMGEAWPLFRERILTDTLPEESLRLPMLNLIGSDLPSDEKKLRMRALDRGRTYSYIVRNYFVDMRRSVIRLSWNTPVINPVGEGFSLMFPQSALLAPPQFVALQREPMERVWREKKTIFAVKTNLLYDLVTALNVELEFPINRKFSIAIEDVFPWWSWGPNDRKYCFQMWEMGIEPRWWFKPSDQRKVLSGQFLGVYVMTAKYDFQWNAKACYQGEYWSAGVTYGYAMKLSQRFNMEFSASAGYLSSNYRHYVPSDDYGHLWRDRYKTGNVGYFGLTKLKASLVYPINKTVKHKEVRSDE